MHDTHTWPLTIKPRPRGQSDPKAAAQVARIMKIVDDVFAKGIALHGQGTPALAEYMAARTGDRIKHIRSHMHAGSLGWDLIEACEAVLATRSVELFPPDVHARHSDRGLHSV